MLHFEVTATGMAWGARRASHSWTSSRSNQGQGRAHGSAGITDPSKTIEARIAASGETFGRGDSAAVADLYGSDGMTLNLANVAA